jgi:hypothetical protein
VQQFTYDREPQSVPLRRTLISRLLNEGRFDQAFATYRRFTGRDGNALSDGDFTSQPRFVPIDWQLAENGGLNAAIARVPGADGSALVIQSSEGRGGEVARQIMGLRPGRYTLEATVGEVAGTQSERPVILVRCAVNPALELDRLVLPEATGQARHVQESFSVPAGCDAQWIVIEMPPAFEKGDREPWIDAIRIRASSQ